VSFGGGERSLPDALRIAALGRVSDTRKLLRFLGILLAALVAVALIGYELRSSWLESRAFAAIARHSGFALEPGAGSALLSPGRGPYDQRLGYIGLNSFVNHLRSRGFVISAQARSSATARMLTRLGLFPVYHEKTQAGLSILDRHGRTLRAVSYPRQAYPDFSSIPPLVVNTLRFIENRDLLDRSRPYRNPAIEWDRLGRAVEDLSIRTVDRKHPLVGGSTLATQLEKMRHSPGGRTGSVAEKARQMATASLRVYLDGPDTIGAQKEIICDYLNSIPLAAVRGHGEVRGLADGLRVWYGADFDRVNRLLATPEAAPHSRVLAAQARSYREVLSLLLALRQPSRALSRNPVSLARQTNAYLRALAGAGVITPRLRDAALHTHLRLAPARPEPPDDFLAAKGPNAIRMALLPALGLSDTYALDHLDLTVRTTLDGPAQASVSGFLDNLNTSQAIQQAGLNQYQLLDHGDPGSVIYSVTLYERGPHANLLRVQTDNYNQPLNINQGTRLQLGSTAKLRTLIDYLQIVEQLHGQLAGLTAAQLRAVPILPGDALTEWAVGYLSATPDRSLEPMLQAALQRKYSGNPGEAFFTAGGLHTFGNFQHSEDGRIFTVSQGFQQSVNLVFIRLMRDIERYYMFRVPAASPTVLTDRADPARRRYLERFADFEGSTFLGRFYDQYQDQSPDQALETLAAGVRLTPLRAAVIFRSVRPQAGLDQFLAFLRAHLPASALAFIPWSYGCCITARPTRARLSNRCLRPARRSARKSTSGSSKRATSTLRTNASRPSWKSTPSSRFTGTGSNWDIRSILWCLPMPPPSACPATRPRRWRRSPASWSAKGSVLPRCASSGSTSRKEPRLKPCWTASRVRGSRCCHR
jgi:membrane peptidoglycan carboxypeptidase